MADRDRAIVISNVAAEEVRPGSMAGCCRALVVDGQVREITEPEVDGEPALRPGWPSMFRGYLNDEERYRKSFVD